MSNTIYKGALLPTVAGDSGVWGTEQNTQTFATFDAALGGYAAQSLSNVNVTLTTSQAGMALLKLTGTLSGNVQITTSTQGFQYIENLTTGAFTVTVTNGVGSPFTLPQGVATPVIFDATNGARSGATLTAALLASILTGTVPLLSSGPVKASILAHTKQDITQTTASLAIDCSLGMTAEISLQANVTSISFTNWPSGAQGVLTLNITNTGSFTMTGWPGPYTLWPQGVAPSTTLGASARDTYVITSSNTGDHYKGFIAGQHIS